MDTITTSSGPEFTKASVHFIKEKITNAINSHGSCILGLSGGSTPGPVYEELGKDASIDWSKVWIFLVDERYVPADHPDSNQKMVRETLLKHAPIPTDHVMMPDTSLPLAQCIDQYQKDLAELFAMHDPDLLILGMGEDGHTASLFPPLGDDAFSDQLVIHTTTDRFAVHDRITVTMLVLKKAKTSLLLLKGTSKKSALDAMNMRNDDERRWPLIALRNCTILLCS